MASLTVDGMDKVLEQLSKLSDQSRVEAIAKKAVKAAAPLNEAATRNALAASEKGPYSTGSAAASVKSTDAKVNVYGVYSVARPTGRDSKGKSNVMKANILEYGAPRTPARPWRDKAVRSAEKSCQRVMEDIVTKEMELD